MYYEALDLIHISPVQNQDKIIGLTIDIMNARHENYDINNYKDYHYTFIEQRALFTYSTLFESTDRPKYMRILEYLFTIDSSPYMQPTVLFKLKILFNLIVNYYADENDKKVRARRFLEQFVEVNG